MDRKVAEEGESWSLKARDWAEVQERFLDPCYHWVLDRAAVDGGSTVLDVGCGARRCLALAAGRGAEVTGVDAAEGMLGIAEERSPLGSFHLADMEKLPFEDKRFDLVTGFNSFSHARDPITALSEARRVVKAGGSVAITVWGPAGPGSAREAISSIMHSLLYDSSEKPPGSHTGPTGPASREEHVHSITAEEDLEKLAKTAGLEPRESTTVECRFSYQDASTMLRGLTSPGPFVEAASIAGESVVREAVVRGMERFKTRSGGYEFTQAFRILISAPSVR